MAFFVSLTNFSICWSIKIRLVFDKSLCPDGSSGSYSTINAMNGVTVCRCAIAIMVILECHSFGDTYNVIDLGALGGYYSRAYDINNVGQIVGLAEVRAGEHRAFLYAKGTMNDLGTLGGKLMTPQELPVLSGTGMNCGTARSMIDICPISRKTSGTGTTMSQSAITTYS